jgi:hypothetical protein
MKKNIFVGIILIVLIGIGIYLFTRGSSEVTYDRSGADLPDPMEMPAEDEPQEETIELVRSTVIGESVEGREIVAYQYGTGTTEILFVGGIHGGYSWNTASLGHEINKYLLTNVNGIPSNVTATVIPVLNPDGLAKVVSTTGPFTASSVDATDEEKVAGRFNGNEVDLNRNFDCDWNSVGVWQNKEVDGGTRAFSEPESIAVRDYIMQNDVDSVVVYYSSAGGVFASSCFNGVLDETIELTNLYADASGYKAYEEFDFYEITGDMVNWLAKEEIPAISVLLTSQDEVELNKNIDGVKAVIEFYAQEDQN